MFFGRGLRIAAAALAASLILAGVFMALSVSDGYKEGERKYRYWEETYTAHQREDEKNSNQREEQTKEQAKEQTEAIIFPENVPERMKIDFEGLQKINSDVIGWISLPAVQISYPVVQAGDNEYYLHRALDREYLFAGSLFLDAENSADFQDDNSIIYGHNMRDGSMFAGLKEYEQKGVCENCPYFWIYTPYHDYLYQIYSVRMTSAISDAYRKEFHNPDSCMKWMRQQKEYSKVKSSVKLLYSGKTVTLSTCTSDPQERQIVQGLCVLIVDL